MKKKEIKTLDYAQANIYFRVLYCKKQHHITVCQSKVYVKCLCWMCIIQRSATPGDKLSGALISHAASPFRDLCAPTPFSPKNPFPHNRATNNPLFVPLILLF